MSASPAMLRLPYFEFEFPVGADHFEVGAAGGDQPSAVGSGGEHDEHVEMQVAQLRRGDAGVVQEHDIRLGVRSEHANGFPDR